MREETGDRKKEQEGGVADGSAESQSQLSPRNQIPESPAAAGIKCTVGAKPEGSCIQEQKQLENVVGSSCTAAKTPESQPQLPRLFMSNGTHDPLVLHSWAKSTFSKLRVSCC